MCFCHAIGVTVSLSEPVSSPGHHAAKGGTDKKRKKRNHYFVHLGCWFARRGIAAGMGTAGIEPATGAIIVFVSVLPLNYVPGGFAPGGNTPPARQWCGGFPYKGVNLGKVALIPWATRRAKIVCLVGWSFVLLFRSTLNRTSVNVLNRALRCGGSW